MDYMPLIFTEADLHAMRGVREAWNRAASAIPQDFPSRKACGEASIAYRRIRSKPRAGPALLRRDHRRAATFHDELRRIVVPRMS